MIAVLPSGFKDVLAHLCQGALFGVGLLMSNATYTSVGIASVANSTGLIMQVVAVAWFWRTRNGSLGKIGLTGMIVLIAGIFALGYCGYEHHKSQKTHYPSAVAGEARWGPAPYGTLEEYADGKYVQVWGVDLEALRGEP